MERQQLERAAKVISARNVTPNVKMVTIGWDSANAKLTLRYYTDTAPSDDDEEFCEIALAELIAEFPDIRKADTACLLSRGPSVEHAEGIVYTSERGEA